MVKVIIGKKGTGKTKALIEMVNSEVKSAHGSVVCIEKGNKLTYDISHDARLIDIAEYPLEGYQGLIGFVSGILAGNYDVCDIFIDSILKMAGFDFNELGNFLDRLEILTEKNKVNFVITVSADESEVPESVKKYVG